MQKFISVSFLLGILLSSLALHADPYIATTVPQEFSATKTSPVKGLLEIENSQYVSSGEPYFRSGADKENTTLRLAIADQLRASDWGLAKIAVNDEFSASERWNYLDVNELYASYKEGRSTLSLGRKLDTWADWEDEWQQGLYQPRYLQNGLRPDVAGLTGLFYESQNEHWAFAGGVLPVNIPESGPHYYVRDDKFVSPNPWFQTPASEFLYRDVPSELHYSVDQSNMNSIVFRPGFITKTEYHVGDYFSRLSYAYKPINQLALGFPSEGIDQLPGYIKITIHARAVYSRTVDWDNNYTVGPWHFRSSLGFDNPETDNGPNNWTSQTYSPAWIYSAGVSRKLEAGGGHAARAYFSFLKVAGGDAPDHGGLASDQTKFQRRFQYYEAYMLGLHKDFRFGWAHPLETDARAIYDRVQNGAVFSLNAAYMFERDWRAFLQMDLIGLVNSASAEINDGFIATFRANDRVGLGVSYVF